MAQPISQADQADQAAIDDLQMEIQFQKVILKSIEDAPAENQAKARADTVSEIKRLEKDLRRLRGGTSTASSFQGPSGSQHISSSQALQSSKSNIAPRENQGMLNDLPRSLWSPYVFHLHILPPIYIISKFTTSP